MSDGDPRRDMKRRNGMVLGISLAIVVGMVGMSFAAVPLYDLFCRVTGFGGTTQVAADVSEVRIGEPMLVNYWAENVSDAPTAGTAVYNVAPAKTGLYFVKVQCFCFEEQVLMPGERMEMPVYFYVDPAIAEDANLDDVRVITLSYRFFPTESEALDDAVEEYYRAIEDATAAAPARRGSSDAGPITKSRPAGDRLTRAGLRGRRGPNQVSTATRLATPTRSGQVAVATRTSQ